MASDRIAETLYDLVVVGGGLAGFATARHCASAGLTTLVVERRPVLGWESTWAFELSMSEDETSYAASAIIADLKHAGGFRDGRLDAPILEMVLDRELAQSGAHLLYYSQPVAVRLQGDTMSGVVVAGKSGEILIRGRVFVDATENALVWRLAGGQAHHVQVPGRSRVFINGVKSFSRAVSLGSVAGVADVVVEESVWAEEVSVSYQLEHTDALEPLRRLPGLLAEIRSTLPELGNAVVTHHTVEAYPVGSSWVAIDGKELRHPHIANLFGAGLWIGGRPEPATVATRLRLGEATGRTVVEGFTRVPYPRPEGATLERPFDPVPELATEVLVCGGGTGGTLAALAATREGAQVTLLEASPVLGGIGVGGGIHIYYHGFPGGLQDDVDELARDLEPLFGPASRVRGYHPIAKRVALAQVLREAGVRIVLETSVTGALTESTNETSEHERPRRRRLTGVITSGPDGRAIHRAEVIVDATGDADVAHMSGQPSTFGREKDHLPHGYSQGAGRIDRELNMLLHMTNFDVGYCDPGDTEDLTRARRLAIEHLWQERFTPETRKTYIAPLIGVRSSRQIVGEERISMRDLVNGRQYDDVIGYSRSHLDNHADDYENETDEAMVWTWLLGFHWRQIGAEIPYRALLPSEVDGLIVGCRALSVSHDAHTTVRMQRDIQRVGEAAGIAAALSVRHGVTPRDIPISELQTRLLTSGALGPHKSQRDEITTQSVHRPTSLAPSFPERSMADWIADLDGDEAREAIWPLYQAGPAAVPYLLEAALDDNTDKAFWVSVVLALFDKTEAAPALIKAVVERRDDRSETVKSAPAWHAAVVLLGRTKSPDAISPLIELTEDGTVGHDVLVAAMRSLGRIGDPTAIEALERVLLRPDVPTSRMLQVSHIRLRDQSKQRAPGVIEDARYAVELTAAEALARLGSPRGEVARRYLDDNRAHVRRFAAKVATIGQASVDTQS